MARDISASPNQQQHKTFQQDHSDCLPLHLSIAEGYVGTKELTNRNDGPAIEAFLQSVGRHKGDAWCAAFVSYCLTKANVESPSVRSGLARHFKLKSSIKANSVLIRKNKIFPGTILIWEKGNTVFGHVGFVITQIDNKSFYTIEGNTSPDSAGSQSDGDGVFSKKRFIQPANYFRITSFTLVE